MVKDSKDARYKERGMKRSKFLITPVHTTEFQKLEVGEENFKNFKATS